MINDTSVSQGKQPGGAIPSARDFKTGRSLASRVRAHWRLKLAGIAGFIAAFFAAYFWTLRAPLFPATIVPTTLLDRLVPFCAGALPLYLSLWVYVSPTSVGEEQLAT